MEIQLVKWGNAQGIRLPKKLTASLGISVNDMLKISTENGKIILEKVFVHRTLEERAKEFGGTLGPYEEYEWGEPQGKEMW
ncbi:MAG: AbrB/MazE/SpoVT family DNA-binding domain-containing protein [Eubacterium sp.]|nr:AbrB/MazE/SpoVT family DNA-binding domain-containing protein [Eubacterium sp.]